MRLAVSVLFSFLAVAFCAAETVPAERLASPERSQAERLVSSVLQALETGNSAIFAPSLKRRVTKHATLTKRVAAAGKLRQVSIKEVTALPSGSWVRAETEHERGVIEWQIAYSSKKQRIETLSANFQPEENVSMRSVEVEQPPANRDPDLCKIPELCSPPDERTVTFLYATNRRLKEGEVASFTGARGTHLQYGAARVRIPEGHALGQVERPLKLAFWGYTFEKKTNEAQHFVVKSSVLLTPADWKLMVERMAPSEALVFVHGYRTLFEQALYRQAQIIYDLQYTRGLPVLFTWPSMGKISGYFYDRASAELSRDAFLELIRTLRDSGIQKIHVLAHSLGNQIVLDALATESRSADPLRIAELIMAAPDVDRDVFISLAPRVREIVGGMTIYASSADRALATSRRFVGIARAGDISPEPVVLPRIETIDVTVLGQELLGLNHDVYVKGRKVVADIQRILLDSTRPPDKRLPEIRSVPPNPAATRYWRYAH